MTELVIQSSNGNDVTTSLIVAEVFGKEHKNVLRDIENLSCSEDFNRLNFERITYYDVRNREQTAYEMTKDGFSFLVMGYTGSKAGEFKEKFINEFNQREALLKDDDYILMRSQQILQKRIEIAEHKIKQLEDKTARQEPLVSFAQTAFQAEGKVVDKVFKIIRFSFGSLYNCCIFAVRQLYLHNSYVDFLYPYGILFNNILEKLHSCLYLPHSSKEVVADLGCTSPFCKQTTSFHATTK